MKNIPRKLVTFSTIHFSQVKIKIQFNSDIIFEVGNTELGKKNFYCHKAILSSMSDPFKGFKNLFNFQVMFTNGMKETSSKTVVINDIKPDVFYQVLSFIYTGSINLSVSSFFFYLFIF
jgi:hypothetical protein